MKNKNNIAFSVILPVYNQASFVRRAIKSMMAQTYDNWELIIVNDGSTDRTAEFVASFIDGARVRYISSPENEGLGRALNRGLDAASNDYITYLPADDFYDGSHLEKMADAFRDNENAAVVFSGIRYDESEEPGVMSWRTCKGAVPGHALQLVQTAHRKTEDRWTEREELVTEDLFIMFWRKLTRRGVFVPTGTATCEWTSHPFQRHKICGERYGGGLNKYRAYYHVSRPLRFRASRYKTVDEKEAYAEYRRPLQTACGDGLKILIVGELAYNPERIRALEEAGHRLYGLWAKPRFCYSTVGPLPFGQVEDVPYDQWRKRVEEIKPDIIYALLSTSAIDIAHEVLSADTGIPFVWHFKEGPHEAMKDGLWDKLIDLYTYADGCIYLNDETRKWFGLFIPDERKAPQMTLDGDMPKKEVFKDCFLIKQAALGNLIASSHCAHWHCFSRKLSELYGGVHTVVTGRIVGITPKDMSILAANDVHVHLYNENTVPDKVMAEPFLKAAPGHFHVHLHCPQNEWVSEFSRYDAGWLHCVGSNNGGSLFRATWADLNLPARISTLAAACLPMIQRRNDGNISAQQEYVKSRGMGLFYDDIDELVALLKDRKLLEGITRNVMAVRDSLTFDSHVDELTAFFRRVIEWRVSR